MNHTQKAAHPIIENRTEKAAHPINENFTQKTAHPINENHTQKASTDQHYHFPTHFGNIRLSAAPMV